MKTKLGIFPLGDALRRMLGSLSSMFKIPVNGYKKRIIVVDRGFRVCRMTFCSLEETDMKDQKKTTKQQDRKISRRDFIGSVAAAAAFTIVPRHVLGGNGNTPPSEKVNIACIGTGGMGIIDMKEFLKQPDVQVVAICDVNASSDYSGFWYGGTAGREPALKIVESYYAEQKPAGTYKGCNAYHDFRKMLEKQKDIDAVVVTTPDHSHAVISMMAIKMGKHVYCEKPLAHSIYEVRKLTEAAQQAKVATQMGNQGHSGEGVRLICEWIWDGAIGPVREVHAWSDVGGWAAGKTDRPKETPPVPSTLDWDLWLGPVPYRPYHPAYAPYNWRGWWDFGTGEIGDMACHVTDPAFWALKLGYPISVEASSTKVNSETTPVASIVRYDFPARGDMPPVELTWYDGGLKPARPKELEEGRKLGNLLIVGDKGKIMCGTNGNSPRLIPEAKMKAYKRPPKTIPRSIGHHQEWIKACKGGKPAGSNFDYSGPLTEVVLLGNIAIRTGKKSYWDGLNMKVTNVPEANKYVNPPYREGWTL